MHICVDRPTAGIVLCLACAARTSLAQAPARVHTVRVTPDTITVGRGYHYGFRALVYADPGVTNRSVSWSSSNPRVVTVDAEGQIASIAAGRARIVATANADPAIKGSAVIRVLPQKAEFSGIAVAPSITLPAPGPDAVYLEFQVDKQVAALPGNPAPHFPASLRSAHRQGEVLAQFIVDAEGRADTTTFKVLESTHPGFTSAVRAVVPLLKFSPAEFRGGKVKQLVQMPFVFRIATPPPRKRDSGSDSNTHWYWADDR